MSPGLVQGRGIFPLSFDRAAIFQTEVVFNLGSLLLCHQHCLVPLCWQCDGSDVCRNFGTEGRQGIALGIIFPCHIPWKHQEDALGTPGESPPMTV